MTREELQKQNDFLLLQLKIINQTLQNTNGMNDTESIKAIGRAIYYSDIDTLRENYDHIKKYDLPYNFFRLETNIDDYRI